ncbi:hypothetical protein AX17_005357 [Amanita inopinata Kibby_2008]|nr:hypothetical protein AX17_005357 [Amanita inopinata Kibby_2008]
MSTSSGSMDLIFIDDSNPNIVYAGNWFTGLGTIEYNLTAHGSTSSGARATYTFKGTCISAYGTLGSSGSNTVFPNGTWSIDGSSPTTFQTQPTSVNQYRELYFQSLDLSDDGDHTLVLTFTADKATAWLDYLMRPKYPIHGIMDPRGNLK